MESKEVEYLLSLHIHLQKEFADWENLDETHQWVLEKTYGILWRRLLELRAYPAVQDAYRTTLREDGNELPSLLYATCYSKYASWAYPEIQDELVAVFERTQNAAVICECCSIMIRTWFAASRSDREEIFPGAGIWKPTNESTWRYRVTNPIWYLQARNGVSETNAIKVALPTDFTLPTERGRASFAGSAVPPVLPYGDRVMRDETAYGETRK